MPDRRTLLLMRHAKSSWEEDTLSDEDRPLNKRGKQAARFMGEHLRERGLVPDAIVSSGALRARDTTERVAKAGKFKAKARITPALYFAGPGAYLQEIAKTGESIARLLVVGHNPDLELLVKQLTGADESMPTAAVALIEIEAGTWAAILEHPRCTLQTVLRPRELQGDGDA